MKRLFKFFFSMCECAVGLGWVGLGWDWEYTWGSSLHWSSLREEGAGKGMLYLSDLVLIQLILIKFTPFDLRQPICRWILILSPKMIIYKINIYGIKAKTFCS